MEKTATPRYNDVLATLFEVGCSQEDSVFTLENIAEAVQADELTIVVNALNSAIEQGAACFAQDGGFRLTEDGVSQALNHIDKAA